MESAAVGQPLFNLGIKCQPRQGLDNLRAEMLADITMQTLSGSSSPLYQEMLQSGLVNESFSSEVFNGDGFFTMIFGGESRDPQAVREKVTAAILDAQKNGLTRSCSTSPKSPPTENWCGSWAMFPPSPTRW